jgi:hypothetical protein
MKTLEEITQELKKREDPLTEQELIDLKEIVKHYGAKSFLKLMDDLGGAYDRVIKPNMTPDIKRQQLMGKVKEMKEYLDELLKSMGDKKGITEEHDRMIEGKFGMRSVDFMSED